MKFFITFKIQNPEYDSKYAKEYHFGKESDGNWKDLWSVCFQLSENILEYKETKDSVFDLVHLDSMIFKIKDVTIINCLTDKNVKIEIVVSSKLIDKIHLAHNAKYNVTRYYFYLKHDIKFCKISDLIYLAEQDIPSELLTIGE